MGHDLETEIRLLELLLQPDPIKALKDYFEAVERLESRLARVLHPDLEEGGEADV